MSIVNNVKALADAKGITLRELGIKLGIGENAVYKWDKSSPKVETIAKVAEFFNVSIDSLVGNFITIEEYKQNKPTDPYILLGEKAKEKGMPPEVLEKLIEFYTKK